MEGVFPEQGLWAGTTDVLEQLVLSEGLSRTPWEAGSAPTPTTLCDSAPPAVTTRAVPHTAGHPLGGGGAPKSLLLSNTIPKGRKANLNEVGEHQKFILKNIQFFGMRGLLSASTVVVTWLHGTSGTCQIHNPVHQKSENFIIC